MKIAAAGYAPLLTPTSLGHKGLDRLKIGKISLTGSGVSKNQQILGKKHFSTQRQR